MANNQRERATLEILQKKRPAEKEVLVSIPGDDGPVELSMLFRAIGADEYDKLQTKYPPTTEQKRDGLAYDVNRFAPDLISRVCVDPAMSYESARDIWTSSEWNQGEIMSLFRAALEVCNRGLDLNPTDSG